MSRFWPFRSTSNFVISVLAFTGSGLYINRMIAQQKFTNPVVGQSIKILSKNEKIKEMIGYPLSYQASMQNRYNEAGNQIYFSFRVMGPRGATEVEVTATHKKAQQIYEYDSQNQALKLAEAKLKDLQKQFHSFKNAPAKIITWGNSTNEEFKKEKQLKQRQMKQIKQRIQNIKSGNQKQKSEYYIPDKQYYQQITKQSAKGSSTTLPQSAQLYRIQNIACQLPNKSRITIINQGQIVHPQDFSISPLQISFNNYSRPTYGPLHEKLAINVSELSQEEIAQYSKHKTSFMYSKHGMYRVFFMGFAFITAGSVFVYFSKNKTRNMSNSVLYQIMKNTVYRHPQVNQFIRKSNLKTLDIDNVVAGGMKNKFFDCQIAVNNVMMGKIEISGNYLPTDGKYNFEKFVFRYMENNVHKEINLLK